MVSTTSRLRHASFVYQFLDPQDHGIPDIIEAFFCPFTGIFSVAIDIPQFQDWVICRRKFFQSQAETEIEHLNDLEAGRSGPPWNGRSGIRASGYGALRVRANHEVPQTRCTGPRLHGPSRWGITVVHSIHRVGRGTVPSRNYERAARAAPTVTAPITRTSV